MKNSSRAETNLLNVVERQISVKITLKCKRVRVFLTVTFQVKFCSKWKSFRLFTELKISEEEF